MGRFNKVKDSRNKLRNEILDKILGNQDLLKYIYYNSDNPLSENDIETPTDLIKTKIFTRLKIMDTITDPSVFLVIRIANSQKSSSYVYKDIDIIFDVYCHDLLTDLYDSDDRVFCILDEIDTLFNAELGKGWIGKMEFVTDNEVYVNKDFYGWRAIYRIVDFS